MSIRSYGIAVFLFIAFVFLAASAASQTVGDTVQIHFLCRTASSATEVAYNIGDAIPGVTGIPADCEWLHGQPMERRLSIIESVIEPIPLDDGRIVYVAAVSRTGLIGGFSAGYLELGMS